MVNAELAQKILRSVSYDQGFHFFSPDGHYSGETAITLCIFLRDIPHVDTQSIRFHFQRGDFQKWLRNTIGDEELAQTIDTIEKTCNDETLVQQLFSIVEKRIVELKASSGQSITS